jgi:hypothetical protein
MKTLSMSTKALGMSALLALSASALADCQSTCTAAAEQARASAYNAALASGMASCAKLSSSWGQAACVASVTAGAAQAGSAAYSSAYNSCMASC